MKRVLGPVDLTLLGIGAIIGTGIFVLTGQAAAAHAGPAVVLSMIVAGMASGLAALCYCGVRLVGAGRRLGLHLRLRDARRAGRLDHRLGPGARVRARRRDGRGGLVGLRRVVPADVGIQFPPLLSAAPGTAVVLADGSTATALFNLPAMLISAAATVLLVDRHPGIGARQRRDRRHQGRRGAPDHRPGRDVHLDRELASRSFRPTPASSANSAGAACCAAPA